uniref:restriction endonuclease subunit S n=1 Tax=Ruminococcus bromii TaxID=40518 RepID=UPI0040262E82
MSAITAKASRKMKKYAVLTREPRCFLGSFDFSWEQRKLSEITDKVTEKNAGLQYVETFTNSAEFGIISQRDFFDHDIAKLGSLDGYYIVKNEDFVYNPRISTSAPVGPINRNKLGRTGVMSPLYTVFRPHDIDTTYLEYFFKCGYWHSFMNFNGDSGARSDRFSIRDNVFFQMPIPIPDIDEQRKIGELLTCLDNLITLHQRKCANLCSPSQVVFSLLFATSTFSWEQRKLGELGTITTGNTPSTSIPDYYSDDGIVWVTPTDICENITFESARKLSDLGQQVGRVVPKNTILVTCIASIGKNTMLGNTGSFNQQINGLTPNENKYDPYFLLTESALWSAKMKGSAASGTMQIVNRTEFSELKTWLPSLIEQQAIGAFFKQLDNLITLHQRECISFTGRADRLILTANKKRTTSSWEQRKLGEMGQTYTGLSGKTKDDFGHGQARFVTYMNVFSNPISNPEMTEPIEIDPKQNEVEVGDVFFTTSSETPEEVGMSSILLEKRGKTYLNSFCFGFRPSEKIDSYYLAYMLRSESTRAKIILLAQGISRYNISKNKVMEIAVSLPSLDEQKMIGQYFSQLDNLITLHQRKPFLMKWRTSDANRNQTNRLVL